MNHWTTSVSYTMIIGTVVHLVHIPLWCFTQSLVHINMWLNIVQKTHYLLLFEYHLIKIKVPNLKINHKEIILAAFHISTAPFLPPVHSPVSLLF